MNGIRAAALATATLVLGTAAASAQDWTGGYVGGSLAYVMSSATYCDNSSGPPYLCSDAADGLPEPEPSGVMYGLTAGYNFQSGNIVYGIAGDLLFGDLSDVAGDTISPSYGCTGAGCGLEVSSIAMLRGRIGYDAGQIMPFATAGIAWTEASAFSNGQPLYDGTYTNFVFGLGLDYAVSDTMTVGFDVLHLFEGNDTIFNDFLCADCGATEFSATIARINIAYRF